MNSKINVKSKILGSIYLTFFLSSCSRYMVMDFKDLEYCRDFDGRVYVFKGKSAPCDAKMAKYGGTFLPFTYSDTFENEFFKLQMAFGEQTYYNDQVLTTKIGKKYSILRLDKFDSKILVSEEKYLNFISINHLDTSDLILLTCPKVK